MSTYFENYILESIEINKKILKDQNLQQNLSLIVERIICAFKKGNKLILAGNGGSAADCQHIAAEFVNRLNIERSPLPCIALTTDSSVLTSIANDYGFDCVFSKQLKAIAKPEDVFWGFSTSGSSVNILKAFRSAKLLRLSTVGFFGSNYCNNFKRDVQLSINIPSNKTAKIQECHIILAHLICDLVEQTFI